MLWTHNPITVEKTWYITQLFACGTALNAMITTLFSFTFALNWTRFALFISIFSALIAAPLISLITWIYGTSGAAVCWIVLNALYVIFVPYIVHNKFLKGELFSWYWKDTFKPLASCILFISMINFIISTSKFTPVGMLIFFSLSFIAAIAITIGFSDKIKDDMYQLVVKQIKKI